VKQELKDEESKMEEVLVQLIYGRSTID